MKTKEQELKAVEKIAEAIHQNGGRTFFVGGFVRDRLLGKESKDIDLEIHGVTEQELETILSSFGTVEHIGAKFGILMIRGLDVDFCLPRQEIKTGEKHTDFDVEVDPFIGTFLASKRRDFTINAIMEDVLTGEVIDHFNGRDDLEKKQIRMVDRVTFQEDSLRVLRACQFASRFGFSIEEATLELCQQLSFTHLSKERVQDEFRKGITKGNPTIFFEHLLRTGATEKIIPDVVGISLPHFKKKEQYLDALFLLLEKVSEEKRETVLSALTDKKADRKWVLKLLTAWKELTLAGSIEKAISSLMDLNATEQALLARLEEKMTHDTRKLFKRSQELISSNLVTISGNDLIESGIKPSPMFHVELKSAKIRQIMTGWSNAEVLHSLT